MSVEASSWAWEQTNVSQSEKLVLLYLADKAGDNGISWHSRARIADHCLYKNPKSIQKIIASLEKKGLVKRFKRFTKTGDQSSNYVVVLFSGRDESDDDHFLDKDYEKPENIGGSVQTPPKNPVNKGGSIQTPPGVCTDPTGGSDRPPKRNRTVNETTTTGTTSKNSKSILSRFKEKPTQKMSFEDFQSGVIEQIDTRIYIEMAIPCDMQEPPTSFISRHSSRLFNKYRANPCLSTAAEYIINDWLKLQSQWCVIFYGSWFFVWRLLLAWVTLPPAPFAPAFL